MPVESSTPRNGARYFSVVRELLEDLPSHLKLLNRNYFMPKRNFARDYLGYGSTVFVSRRLRDIMALPDSEVQYIDIELLDGSQNAFDNDYRRINILAHHPAIDLQHSVCEMGEGTRYATGEAFRFIRSYTRTIIRDDTPTRRRTGGAPPVRPRSRTGGRG